MSLIAAWECLKGNVRKDKLQHAMLVSTLEKGKSSTDEASA